MEPVDHWEGYWKQKDEETKKEKKLAELKKAVAEER